MGDNTAILDGYTREVEAHGRNGREGTLYLLVKPDTDFTDNFRAWDMDQQEYITVEQWYYTVKDAPKA